MTTIEEMLMKLIKEGKLYPINGVIQKFFRNPEYEDEAALSAVDDAGNGFLHAALDADQLGIAHYLLKEVLPEDAIKHINSDGMTALMILATKKYSDEKNIEKQNLLVSRLLTYCLIDAVNNNGETALWLAARINNADLVLALINKGANFTVGTSDSVTPLHVASQLGHAETVEIILRQLPRSNYYADAETKQAVSLKRHAILNARDKLRNTPLHLAAGENRANVVNLLLEEEGLVLSSRNIGGDTPLLLAARAKHVNVGRALAMKRAGIDEHDNDHKTALHYACEEGLLDLARELLKNGADYSKEDTQGRTALDKASEHSYLMIIAQLFSYGAAIGVNLPKQILPVAQQINADNCLLLATRLDDKSLGRLFPTAIKSIRDPRANAAVMINPTQIVRECRRVLNTRIYNTSREGNELRIWLRDSQKYSLKNYILYLLNDVATCNRIIQRNRNIAMQWQALPKDLKLQLPKLAQILNPVEQLPNAVIDNSRLAENLENPNTYLDNLNGLIGEINRLHGLVTRQSQGERPAWIILTVLTMGGFCLGSSAALLGGLILLFTVLGQPDDRLIPPFLNLSDEMTAILSACLILGGLGAILCFLRFIEDPNSRWRSLYLRYNDQLPLVTLDHHSLEAQRILIGWLQGAITTLETEANPRDVQLLRDLRTSNGNLNHNQSIRDFKQALQTLITTLQSDREKVAKVTETGVSVVRYTQCVSLFPPPATRDAVVDMRFAERLDRGLVNNEEGPLLLERVRSYSTV